MEDRRIARQEGWAQVPEQNRQAGRLEAHFDAYVSLITCFNADDTINYSAVRNQVRRQIGFGNNILVCDMLGDLTCLTHAEKVRLCAEVVEEADGRVKVLATIGMPSTYQSVLLGRDISGLGIDGATVLAPFFADCPDEDLIDHYTRVADSLDMPIYLYNAPAVTMRALSADLISIVAEHENIRGLKDNGQNPALSAHYLEIAKANEAFDYYAGVDSRIHDALSSGAAGCMSDLGNVLPRTLNTLCLTMANGSRTEALKRQSLLTELYTDLTALGPLSVWVKQLLYLMDNNVGLGRQPFPKATPSEQGALGAIIEKYQIV